MLQIQLQIPYSYNLRPASFPCGSVLANDLATYDRDKRERKGGVFVKKVASIICTKL